MRYGSRELITLPGELSVPGQRKASFFSQEAAVAATARNQYVAQVIRDAGVGTLLDLLTREEERIDLQTRHLRFDTVLLATVGRRDEMGQETN